MCGRGMPGGPSTLDGVPPAGWRSIHAPRIADPQLVEQIRRERPLIALKRTTTTRALRSQCAGRHAAPVGQRVTGMNSSLNRVSRPNT